jgi:hypothetical protein
MIRRSILSHVRPAFLLMLVAVAAPIPAAHSQDRAIQDRLDRLERDLSMLQRQVYRSGPPPVITAGTGAAVDAELRMDRLEAQMRDLTGRVEDAVNGVDGASATPRANQQRYRREIRQGQGNRGSRRSPCPCRHHGSSPTGAIAMRGPDRGDSAPSRLPSLMPQAPLVPPPRDPPSRRSAPSPSGPPAGAGTRDCRRLLPMSGGALLPPSSGNTIPCWSVEAGRLFGGGRGVEKLHRTTPG